MASISSPHNSATRWGMEMPTTSWDTETISISNHVVILANLGPLTTTFTPSSYCLSIYYFTSHLDSTTSAMTARSSYTGSECWPPSFVSAQSIQVTHTQADIYGYYSPGICPSGYVTACADHTILGDGGYCCCPSGYKCYYSDLGYPRGCTSFVVGSAVLTNIEKTEELLTITTGAIYTDVIRIRAGQTPVMAGPTLAFGTGSSIPSDNTTTGHGSGACIAIGLSAAVIAATLLGILWFCCRKRHVVDTGKPEAGQETYELDPNPSPIVGVEANSEAVHELPLHAGNGPPGFVPAFVMPGNVQRAGV